MHQWRKLGIPRDFLPPQGKKEIIIRVIITYILGILPMIFTNFITSTMSLWPLKEWLSKSRWKNEWCHSEGGMGNNGGLNMFWNLLSKGLGGQLTPPSTIWNYASAVHCTFGATHWCDPIICGWRVPFYYFFKSCLLSIYDTHVVITSSGHLKQALDFFFEK